MMIFDYFRNPPSILNISTGIAEGVLCVLALTAAILMALSIHEFSHAYVAYKCGDDTARLLGRVTLNPIKHIDPMGFFMLLIAGFGWAKPVPVSPNRFKKRVRDDIFVSLAGVVTNLITAFFSVAILGLLQLLAKSNATFFESSKYWYLLFYLVFLFFTFFVMINIGLALFNIIPIFPLDGFHVLQNLLGADSRVVWFLRRYGMYILLGLIVLGMFMWTPLDWYIITLRGIINGWFIKFWGLFGLYG